MILSMDGGEFLCFVLLVCLRDAGEFFLCITDMLEV
jgi:hypothetical protein